MNGISYDTIAPNVAQVDVNASQVQVTWKCPATGRQVGQSTAYMSADASLGGRVQASVKRSIVQEIIYGITRFIASLVGGTAGRVVSNAAYTAAGDIQSRTSSSVEYNETSRRAAIVQAFEAVKTSFAWDEGRRQYVAR